MIPGSEMGERSEYGLQKGQHDFAEVASYYSRQFREGRSCATLTDGRGSLILQTGKSVTKGVVR